MKKLIIILILISMLTGCSEDFSTEKEELALIANNLNSELKELNDAGEYLSNEYLKLFDEKTIKNNLANIDKNQYIKSVNGIYYSKKYDDLSSAILTGCMEIDEALVNKLYFTEPIETKFREVYHQYPQVKQISIVDKTGYARIYPGIDILTQIKPGTDFKRYDFYKLAMSNNNDESVWIDEPHVDPFGRGWIINLSTPSYKNNEPLGVVNIGITTNYIRDKFLKENMLIVTDSGNLIALDSSLSGLLDIMPLKKHNYTHVISDDSYLQEDYNLLKSKNKDVRDLFNKMFKNENQDSYTLKLDQTYKFISIDIPEINWKLIKVIK